MARSNSLTFSLVMIATMSPSVQAATTKAAAEAVSTPSAAELFVSRQITPSGAFTKGIEGPAVDRDGVLYVVNFGKSGTVGRVVPDGKPESFVDLPTGSIGNAIRFDREGRMFVADYKKHNVLEIKTGADGKREVVSYFHDPAFHQPNDLTVGDGDVLYASDPNWKKREGRIWRVSRGDKGAVSGKVIGRVMKSERKMGPTNGVEVSPDGRMLYVSESMKREIWSYRIDGESLKDAKLVVRFKDFDIDGIRTDSSGRIFAARIEKGTIAIVSIKSDGTGVVDKEVALTGKEPTNLAFGGPDGKTVYVTQRAGGYIESFRTDRPGREWCLQRSGSEAAPNSSSGCSGLGR